MWKINGFFALQELTPDKLEELARNTFLVWVTNMLPLLVIIGDGSYFKVDITMVFALLWVNAHVVSKNNQCSLKSKY